MDRPDFSRSNAMSARALWKLGIRLLGGVVAGIALLAIVGVLVFASLRGQARCDAAPLTTPHREPCRAVTDHFQAVAAKEWTTAQRGLSTALRAYTTPTDLQRQWSERGEVDYFIINLDPADQEIGGTTAFIDRQLQFKDNRREHVVVYLIREEAEWKIARLP